MFVGHNRGLVAYNFEQFVNSINKRKNNVTRAKTILKPLIVYNIRAGGRCGNTPQQNIDGGRNVCRPNNSVWNVYTVTVEHTSHI